MRMWVGSRMGWHLVAEIGWAERSHMQDQMEMRTALQTEHQCSNTIGILWAAIGAVAQAGNGRRVWHRTAEYSVGIA